MNPFGGDMQIWAILHPSAAVSTIAYGPISYQHMARAAACDVGTRL